MSMSLHLCKDGLHELTLSREKPTPAEIAAVERGHMEIALSVQPDLAILYYRLEGNKAWAFAQISRPGPGGNRAAWTTARRGTAAAPVFNLLRVALADAATGEVKACAELRLTAALARQLRSFLTGRCEKSVVNVRGNSQN